MESQGQRHRVESKADALCDPRFQSSANGAFRERFGPPGKGAPYSQKKLCLVATDAAFLVDLLYGISQRSDCHYVKYGTKRRDGMVLGRCFFTTDEASAELCHALKGHPKLMVTVQDDDFFNAYREAPVPDGGCALWDDMPHEVAEVLAVHEAAFGRPDEARMVKAVGESGVPVISLVAGVKAETGAWRIVGHVLLSPVSVVAPARDAASESDAAHTAVPRQTDTQETNALRGLGLAPLAVLPEFQRRGYGAQLARAALQRASLLGYGYAVVLGHAPYYSRFGFVRASHFGLRYEADVSAEHFMALELAPGALDGASGVVRYHDAFG